MTCCDRFPCTRQDENLTRIVHYCGPIRSYENHNSFALHTQLSFLVAVSYLSVTNALVYMTNRVLHGTIISVHSLCVTLVARDEADVTRD